MDGPEESEEESFRLVRNFMGHIMQIWIIRAEAAALAVNKAVHNAYLAEIDWTDCVLG